MIKGKMNLKFKRPKLTLEQKAMRNVFKEIGKPLRDEVRRGFPRMTGALYFSIAFKVKSNRQNDAFCVVGAKVRYGKFVKGHNQEIIPNKYIGKVEKKHNVMVRYSGDAMLALIHEKMKSEVEKLLNA